MATAYTSPLHVFSLMDITGTFSGETYADNPSLIDITGSVVPQITDKDGNVLSGIDNEFGFYVTDFIGAEAKVLDGDYSEGFAGNIYDPNDPTKIIGLALSNVETDVFRSGAPLGTWSLGLSGQTVKASTEHYVTMADILSDQLYPGDPNALAPLDDDLRLLDMRPTGTDGAFEAGVLHELYVEELTQALQRSIDNNEAGTNPISYSDIDFDRDGINDTFTTMDVSVDFDTDGDGTAETILVAGVDLDNDGTADIVDSFLNGFGGTADIVDLLQPNESSVTYNIAYGQDYSVTLKDDGKLLYRWGEAVKRPNDIRMEAKMELPDDWTRDDDGNGVADSTEDGSLGYAVISAELVINHDITNNPNDQVRPEDYENEAAIGRLPSYYVVQDPDNPDNTLWVSPVDTYNGEGEFLPSYFKLTADGAVDLTAGGIAVYDPDGVLVGYRNVDSNGDPVGTVLRDMSLVALNAAAELPFTTGDLDAGFTVNWYTTTDREPFEWSYDMYSDDPYRNVYESFRSPDDAADAGYDVSDLVSGPRWRLTPNKFGQDLPGLEIPLIPNSPPPFKEDNIKYKTGDSTTTTLNLLDWAADADGDGVPDPSPFATSAGWMLIDPARLDTNSDGVIDDGWSQVDDGSGTLLGAGDAMPAGPILAAVTPNGMNLSHDFFDTAVYLKGDQRDSAKIYDMELKIEFAPIEVLGSVQEVTSLSSSARTTSYQDGSTFENPVVFMTPPSMIGAQIATVAISEITDTGVTAYMKEPNYLDGKHVGEDVTMLTLEEGTWDLVDGTKLEVGTTTIAKGATENFQHVTFEQSFDSAPTVLVQLQTDNGAQWAIARVRNVTETGFDVALQEEEDSDGFHVSEVVGWVAIEADNAPGLIDWGGVDSQAFTMEKAVNHLGGSVALDTSVGTDPLVAAFLSSYNGADPVTLRLVDTTDDGTSATIEFLAQEDKSLDAEVSHTLEDVSGLVFEQAGLLTGYQVADEFLFA